MSLLRHMYPSNRCKRFANFAGAADWARGAPGLTVNSAIPTDKSTSANACHGACDARFSVAAEVPILSARFLLVFTFVTKCPLASGASRACEMSLFAEASRGAGKDDRAFCAVC